MDRRTQAIAALTLTIIAVMSFGIGAGGRSRRLEDITSVYYREIEHDYVLHVREVLEQNGYDNPGVGLTKVVNDNGGFDYTVSVHHRRIDRMDERQRDALAVLITDSDIAVADSSVKVRYIEY